LSIRSFFAVLPLDEIFEFVLSRESCDSRYS
jgi:hypothetical protein